MREENTVESIIPQELNGSGRNGAATRVRSLMEVIRERTKGEIEQSQDERLSYQAYRGDFHGKRKAGEILHSEELRYLNEHYHYASHNVLDDIVSHRGGILGKVVVRFKRKLAAMIVDGILKGYFEREKEFEARLVRLLNNQAKYIDERDASNFWELVHKIDVDVTRAVDRAERLQDEFVAEHRSSERRLHDALQSELQNLAQQVASLRSEVATQGASVSTVSKVVDGLESIVSRMSKPKVDISSSDTSAHAVPSADGVDYLLLENRFRGSEADIAARLSQYVALFQGASKDVLDIGCGRGELLSLLRDASVPSRGVDLDEGMISVAREAGLAVQLQDGIQALQEASPESLGGIIAIQVVEHLTPKVVQQLIELAYEKLARGGKLVLETINPQSVLALSSNYFRDPTHVFPQHPDTLRYICTKSGFAEAEIRYLSPVPEEALLKKIDREDYMTPRWQFMLDRMNSNIDRLNHLLYGHQDFAVVATKE
ncbi:MAG: class I SAM-dependent methyltransferase [Bdellovibrionota bacterium]